MWSNDLLAGPKKNQTTSCILNQATVTISIVDITFDVPNNDTPTATYTCNVTVKMEFVTIEARRLPDQTKIFHLMPSRIRTVVAKGTTEEIYQHYQMCWYHRLLEFRILQEWISSSPMVAPVFLGILVVLLLLNVWWSLLLLLE